MRRRRFLQVTTASIAALGVGACGRETGPPIPAEGQVLGTTDEVRARIEDGGGAWYVADAQTYLVEVPAADRDDLAAAVDEAVRPGLAAGFLAISQRCPHMACRVPWCDSSGWFECPCHGSRFTDLGERRRGPADRGMSYFALAVEEDTLRLLPGSIQGIEGDEVIDAEPRGPHCV